MVEGKDTQLSGLPWRIGTIYAGTRRGAENIVEVGILDATNQTVCFIAMASEVYPYHYSVDDMFLVKALAEKIVVACNATEELACQKARAEKAERECERLEEVLDTWAMEE